MPLQHASAATLKRMKRGSSGEIFARTIEKIRQTIPGVTLRTSFIVGFPGETEREFQELCAFVEAAEFDWMGSFAYSDQEGAGAFTLAGKLSRAEIESRRRHLMHVQKAVSRRKKKALRGREFEVLVEGPSEESDLLIEARSEMQAPEIDGKLYITDLAEGSQVRTGEFYPCLITEAHDYDLVGRII